MIDDLTQAWINQQREIQNKNLHQSGLQHWFSRETKTKPKPWPVFQSTGETKESLPCPAGIDKAYWENLSKTEQNWALNVEPTTSLEERRRLWQEEQSRKTAEQAKPAESDYFTQAVTPVDPFEEPIKRKAVLLRKKDRKKCGGP